LVSGTEPNPSTVGTFKVDNTNGKLTFTPVNNFTGTATVTYKIYDKNNLFSTATVTVNVVAGTTNYFPASGYGTLAFEDLWPYKGDYDFNDMVVDYQFKVTTNTSNYVENIKGTFILKAFGASYKSGFGFQLSSNIKPNDLTVTGTQLKENIVTLNSNGTEAGQTIPTIIVFDNAFKLMQSPGGIGVNTTPGEPYVTPDTIRINIKFKPNTYTYNQLDISGFNPFIFVNQDRSVEIHLPGYKPTALANKSLFGTGDDASNPATGKYYVTKNNLPWAINIYSSFDYPDEKVPIVNAYLKFAAWAESGGSSYPDWYKNISGYRDDSNIYVIPKP
jgi:LruC domain-containing protein